MREEEEHKPHLLRNPIERNHMGLHLENEVAVVKTPTIISNNPVLSVICGGYMGEFNRLQTQLHQAKKNYSNF